MAIRGSIAKEEIINKILETFPGSFINGKELRIPWSEGAEDLQIKVSLVAAKDMVENPNGTTGFGSTIPSTAVKMDTAPTFFSIEKEPTNEEKQNLQLLMNKLGL